MRIGIIVAMDKELSQLRNLFGTCSVERYNHKGFVQGKIGYNDVIIQQCGIGKVNSAIGTVEMINRYKPDLVVSSGVAGGANPDMNVGDVVVGATYAYHDAYCGSECEHGQIMGMPAQFTAREDILEKAMTMNTRTKIHKGLIVSGEWFVDKREKMAQILRDFPAAAAVDMESCSIAHTCYIYETPFVAFRIISDIPLKDNNVAQYSDFWSSMADSSFNVTKSFLERL